MDLSTHHKAFTSNLPYYFLVFDVIVPYFLLFVLLIFTFIFLKSNFDFFENLGFKFWFRFDFESLFFVPVVDFQYKIRSTSYL